jgi:hypothetical protein
VSLPRFRFWVSLLLLACVMDAGWLSAQPAPPPPPDARGGRGGAPPLPPEQRVQEQLHSLLLVDDAEWAVLQPRIAQVQQLLKERDRFVKPKPPKPPRPVDPNRPDPEPEPKGPDLIVDVAPGPKDGPLGMTNAEMAKAFTQLAVLASSGSIDSAAAVAALNHYRAARAKSDAELARVRTELRELVTAKQEIILVVTGILD